MVGLDAGWSMRLEHPGAQYDVEFLAKILIVFPLVKSLEGLGLPPLVLFTCTGSLQLS